MRTSKFIRAAHSPGVTAPRSKKRHRCDFCEVAIPAGVVQAVELCRWDDGRPRSAHFHLACYGAFLELIEPDDYDCTIEGYDAHEVRAVTPDIYEIAQFLAIHSAERACRKVRAMVSKVQQ